MMKQRYLSVIILLLAVTAQACAQWHDRLRRVVTARHPSALVTHYLDSLRACRAALDSIPADSLHRRVDSRVGIEYKSLFLPLTFYQQVSADQFSLEQPPSPLADTYLHLYLQRPDLVASTQTQIDRAGDVIVPERIEVKHAPDIVETVAPKPVETQAEPVDLLIVKPNFWNISGDYYLQFLQNYVSSNWYKGGESNYSMVGSITLNANYNNKQKLHWDNKLELKLGLQTSREDTLHSLRASENLIRFTSKLGIQASKKWRYTLQLITYTQFMRQWKSNSQTLTTDFLGPLNVNLSLGMDYSVDWLKHRLKGSVHLAPLAYNFRYVNRPELATRYGIEKGKRQLHDFGSQMTVDLNWKFTDNISWSTRLYGYTTYERAEVEWENTFTFQFNRWISTKFFIYPRFDDGGSRDDSHGYLQLKEYASIGFSYSF